MEFSAFAHVEKRYVSPFLMGKIKFGTDGWRGVIAEDFTFDNVRIVAQAVADYLLWEARKRPAKLAPVRSSRSKTLAVVIGYDTRFLSDKFAWEIAQVFSGNGIRVILGECPASTPMVSFTVQDRKLDGGVMLTASHNPPQFNGFKFKCRLGCSAPEEITAKIEEFLYRHPPKKGNLEKIKTEDLRSAYLKKVTSYVDMPLIKRAGLKLIIDPMYGSGIGLMEKILRTTNCQATYLHSFRDCLFGGLHPEPIKKNLGELMRKVKEVKADMGLATDGDADRIGVIDDRGRYLTPHQVFSLLLLYLIEKGLRGKVVQTVSLGYLNSRIASAYNLPFVEVPVGFKYVADIMLKEKVLIGGEESGGYSYLGYLPDRDGVLTSLLFLEMVSRKKKKLSILVDEMHKRFGKSFFERIDLHLGEKYQGKVKELKKEMVKNLQRVAPRKLAGVDLKEIRTLDGIKFVCKDESWLLLRPSGTEPLVRIYAEAESEERVGVLLKTGQILVKKSLEGGRA